MNQVFSGENEPVPHTLAHKYNRGDGVQLAVQSTESPEIWFYWRIEIKSTHQGHEELSGKLKNGKEKEVNYSVRTLYKLTCTDYLPWPVPGYIPQG